MKKKFMVSGMFRSGTTMLARLLHSNPNIVCASDPFAPIFKSYRNKIASELGYDYDSAAPIHDYYLNYLQNKFYQEVQKRDFYQAISSDEIVSLREQVKHHCSPYSPLIVPHISELNGATYAELFESAIRIIRKAYGKREAQIVGFKEVWMDEFMPHFRKLTFRNKNIHLIRDPRAVIASNFVSGSTYPLIFLIRQWRKIVTLAWHNALGCSDVKVIRFEDLVLNPYQVAVELCSFLEVDFHENMTDPSCFADGNGNPWHQNTSYFDASLRGVERKFNRSALEKWQKILSEEVIIIIELFCSKEMSLMGYQPVSDTIVSSSRIDIIHYNDNESHFAEWIKPYSGYNNTLEFLAEFHRLALIESHMELSDQTKRLLALEPTMFGVLSKQVTVLR